VCCYNEYRSENTGFAILLRGSATKEFTSLEENFSSSGNSESDSLSLTVGLLVFKTTYGVGSGGEVQVVMMLRA
jgi:hypothetical protein